MNNKQGQKIDKKQSPLEKAFAFLDNLLGKIQLAGEIKEEKEEESVKPDAKC